MVVNIVKRAVVWVEFGQPLTLRGSISGSLFSTPCIYYQPLSHSPLTISFLLPTWIAMEEPKLRRRRGRERQEQKGNFSWMAIPTRAVCLHLSQITSNPSSQHLSIPIAWQYIWEKRAARKRRSGEEERGAMSKVNLPKVHYAFPHLFSVSISY